MKNRLLIPILIFALCLIGCNKNKDINSDKNIESITETNIIDNELVGFENNIKTTEVINPGMGFYRTRYLTLKRESEKPDYEFYNNGFYHVRIDLSDFSKANNGDSDSDITESAINVLDDYFANAKANKCSLIIRFAYDGFNGDADKEPSISKMKEHIKSLSEVINDYKDLIIAVECGLIGPWGEMHTSILDNQDTYNELIPTWLNEVKELPILVRKPVFIYKYLGYTLDNLDEFNDNSIRLGMYDDGYYGTNLDKGTYETLDARDKETKFINKLNNLTGGECIGEPTSYFSYEEIIKEMKLINLTYLNYEWDNSVVVSWKDKTYNNQSFYNYMTNHMGFKLYVDKFDYSVNNDQIKVDINLANMGFSHITRDLNAKLYFDNNKSVIKTITDSDLNINLSAGLGNAKKIKVYLKITDNLGRSYELMNGKYINELNYLGEIRIK
ncbi:MAG: DUF4874 domain-containing protein [Acholeplasmatales bacterium]|nr:DUF4874 domain-containing protein [Acholeplasmatales bacterium]